jgi:uncharacterized protein (UPF0335 family)
MEGIAADQLLSIIGRVERLEEEKRGIADDIKDIYAEAKSLGYDAKIIRKVVAIRRRKAADVAEEEELLRIYLQAIDKQIPLFEPLARSEAA